jgi:hypothetical protein
MLDGLVQAPKIRRIKVVDVAKRLRDGGYQIRNCSAVAC